VKQRHEAGYQKDLLQMLLEGTENSDLSQDARDRFIVDNCKNIYLAGFETTAVSAAWCLMLLAANPDWQERVRAEVLNICKGQIPDIDMILKMKSVLHFTPPKVLAFIVTGRFYLSLQEHNTNSYETCLSAANNGD
jgi:cytochrome P450 family 714 subfamily C